LDRLSCGRLILGAGLGSVPEEFTAFGEPGDLRERAARLDESLQVLTELWRGEPVTFHSAGRTELPQCIHSSTDGPMSRDFPAI
jgi:alkanesulfonate monooxygenase SsuD/methylene tetrahydromethanopterin reductase-like flavin-dependent oxidoreductase (luciferase family)